jgi:hypothetical protein
VKGDAADGYVLAGHIAVTGLDEFVTTVGGRNRRKRGVFRAEYTRGEPA